MKILHLNAGNDTGGGMVHILSLLNQLNREEFFLGLLEKGKFEQKAKELGINTYTFEQFSRYDVSVLFKLIIFIKKMNIDVIHTHGARANFYGYFIKKITKVVWMTTIHSDPRNDFLGRGMVGHFFTKLNLAVVKKPDHLFAISKRFADMLLEFNIDSNKITTILNGIEFNGHTVTEISREKVKLFQDDFVILMVARFDPVKRHELAISALEEVMKSYRNVKLLLVGDGPVKPMIEELVSKKELNRNVVFLGHQENVAPFYRLADVTLLTSKTESFPLVLLESSREKTTIITTDVGGVREMIPNRNYGIILEKDTVDSIASEIIHLMDLKNKDELTKMGERFYTFTSQNFSIQELAGSMYIAYKNFVSQNHVSI